MSMPKFVFTEYGLGKARTNPSFRSPLRQVSGNAQPPLQKSTTPDTPQNRKRTSASSSFEPWPQPKALKVTEASTQAAKLHGINKPQAVLPAAAHGDDGVQVTPPTRKTRAATARDARPPAAAHEHDKVQVANARIVKELAEEIEKKHGVRNEKELGMNEVKASSDKSYMEEIEIDDGYSGEETELGDFFDDNVDESDSLDESNDANVPEEIHESCQHDDANVPEETRASRRRASNRSAQEKARRRSTLAVLQEDEDTTRLHLGEPPEQRCSDDESAFRRARVAQMLKKVLGSVVQNAKHGLEREHGHDGKSVWQLSWAKLTAPDGPLSAGVLGFIRNANFNADEFVDKTLMPCYPKEVTDVLGKPGLKAEDLLLLPRLSDDELLSRLCYVLVLTDKADMTDKVGGKAESVYVGSAMSDKGGAGRWAEYSRIRQKPDSAAVLKSSPTSYLRHIADEDSEVHARALATGFPEMPHACLLNEALLMIILDSLEPDLEPHSWHPEVCAQWYQDGRSALGDLAIKLSVPGINRATPLKQGVRKPQILMDNIRCLHCKRLLKGTVYRWTDAMSGFACRACLNYLKRTGTRRTPEMQAKWEEQQKRGSPLGKKCGRPGCEEVFMEGSHFRTSELYGRVCDFCARIRKQYGRDPTDEEVRDHLERRRYTTTKPLNVGDNCPIPHCIEIIPAGSNGYARREWGKVTDCWMCEPCARHEKKEGTPAATRSAIQERLADLWNTGPKCETPLCKRSIDESLGKRSSPSRYQFSEDGEPLLICESCRPHEGKYCRPATEKPILVKLRAYLALPLEKRN